jgi:hypothetical protein
VQDIKLVEQELRRAVREALLRHKQEGNPIAVWRDGAVVWIASEDIPVEEAELLVGAPVGAQPHCRRPYARLNLPS